MSKKIEAKPNGSVCKSCVYFKRANDTWGCCDYIGVTGQSRAFRMGRQLLNLGECDKYTPNNEEKFKKEDK